MIYLKQMDKSQILKSLNRRENISMRGLIAELARLLPSFAGRQQKYGVSTYPDERTIRYYMNEGLVDKPAKYRGTSAVFSYRHILQVLAVKYLQAEYLPLNKIKNMLSGLEEKELEDILLSGGGPDVILRSHQASSYAPGGISARRNRILDSGEPAALEEDASFCFERPPVHSRKSPEEWLRISVSDDVELNIKAGSLPVKAKEKKEFMEKLSAGLRMLFENEKNRGGI